MESGSANWAAQPSWSITAEQNYTAGGIYIYSLIAFYSRYANYTNSSLTSKAIDLSGFTEDLTLGF